MQLMIIFYNKYFNINQFVCILNSFLTVKRKFYSSDELDFAFVFPQNNDFTYSPYIRVIFLYTELCIISNEFFLSSRSFLIIFYNNLF